MLLSAACFAGPSWAATPAPAVDEAFQLIGSFSLPGNQSIGTFDISALDADAGIYAFADRTNASVDVFALNDDEFVDGVLNPAFPRQISLAFQVPGFAGAKASHSASGPDGIVIVNHSEIWAGDGNSTVKVINIASHQVTDIIPTGGTQRADEGSFDPVDQVVLIANDAETPFPFISLISAVPDKTGAHQILGQITFDGSTSVTSAGRSIKLPAATNGIEQSQYDRSTGLFYLDIPQDGTNENKGATVVIDPRTFTVEKVFTITGCQPTGMAIGPNNQALLGCSATNDANATPLSAQVISLISGQKLATFPIKGNDEVWFNPGDNNYYAAGQTNVPTSLGIIHADTLKFDEKIPLVPGAHSVAADPISNRIFVPLGAGLTNTICPNGCIGIYASSNSRAK
ncbi:MAG TPA: hypothetical protein VM689_06790 [Aliidongia sp.]|nr:hypothetical protein [Aliidongia sp.]